MKGDFSTFRHTPEDNDQAVLYQQGRVTLDADLTASELIDLHWRAQAGRDVIGAGVAAVPTGDSAGFKVESAVLTGGEVRLGVHPGRVWADGILAYLPPDPAAPDAAVTRVATYLEPPVNTAGPSALNIGREVRDAVVLELALEELNAFQEPARLLEPAIGGPDTAERVTTRVRFGLVRLAPGEDCTTIASKLVDVPAGKGRLTASLAAPAPIEGDCPVIAGGGYSGMEHNLYRVEIAASNAAPASFKWSQFNGGLVGRGTFAGGSTPRCVITANRTAIVSSQLTDFYLEALTFDAGLGYWQVAYGAAAKLDADHELVLSGTQFGSVPAGPSSVFFRLWNGIVPVSAFAGAATELVDGINLAFDAEGPSTTYRPGDYWTFPVRAGDVVNSAILVDGQQPQGAVLRRVALAEITWSDPEPAGNSGPIEDCRRRFAPLTNLKTCCTLRVGDGNTTFGDFDSLEEAAAHLPAKGGELCLLAGTHFANLVLQGAMNVTIHGCGHLTKLLPRQNAADKPIIQLAGGSSVTVRDLDLVSLFGPAIVADGTSAGPVRDIAITSCRVVARTVAIALDHAAEVVIARNRIMLLDTVLGRNAIELRASDALVERNEIRTWPFTPDPAAAPGTAAAGIPTKIQCAQPDAMYGVIFGIIEFVEAAYLKLELAGQVAPYLAAGGIHLLGGCDRVRILDNHIAGGTGHGVALGGLLPGELTPFDPSENKTATLQVGDSVHQSVALLDHETGEPIAGITIYLVRTDDDLVVGSATSATDGAVAFGVAQGKYVIRTTPGYTVQKIVKSKPFLPAQPAWTFHLRKSAVHVREEQGFLYDIAIERNEIEQMALSGIGTFPFADIAFAAPLASAGDLGPFAKVLALLAPVELMRTCNVIQDLVIRDNRIHDNLLAVFDNKLSQAALSVGQGGISLALVERALIAGNRIRDNGISAVHPCCGIFVGHGEDVDVDANEVSGNGPLPDGYDDKQKHTGIRGGIVVRFASSFLVGATAAGRQKRALRIAHNTVDQPAGRAITAFAFGPATCVSNHLNSEREGSDGLLDAVVGGVLLADLGGFQASLGILRLGGAPDTSSLPDGALRFDGNHVRLGLDHRAAITVALATADDLSCEGNQLSAMRPDAFFSSAVCLAPTVRVLGNRFHEHAAKCYFSLLSVGVGFGGRTAMNTTALNQGGHCIVATSAPIGAAAIVDESNIDPDAGQPGACDGVKRLDGVGVQKQLLQGLAETVDVSQKSLAEVQLEASLKSAIKGFGQAVLSINIALVMTTAIEGARTATIKAAASRFTARTHARVAGGTVALDGLKAGLQMLAIDKVAVQAGEAVVSGRVTDAKALGIAGFGVQLVTSDGTPVGRRATSKQAGEFAVTVDGDDLAKLGGKPLFVRAIDAGGAVVFDGEQPLKLSADAAITVPPIEVTVRRATTPDAAGGTKPATSTPLETIRGVGPRTAARLRAAGIADVEALMQTPGARLVELAGKDAHVLKRHVEQATAKGVPTDGDPPR